MTKQKKHQQIKHNHHYVWQHYLKSWAMGKDIFYTTKKGKIACDSIVGLARERDFYRINPLTSEDVEYIKLWSSVSSEFTQEIHMGKLNHFIKLSHIARSSIQHKDTSSELAAIAETVLQNGLENTYSFIEEAAAVPLNALAEGDASILTQNQNMIAFCSYIGHQITRTKALKDRAIMAIQTSPSLNKHPQSQKLTERNWWFLALMLGMNLGMSLYESRDRGSHILIKNRSETPFITSDHPVINVHHSLKAMPQGQAPDHGDYYFPLSPTYAYMINDSSDYDHLAYSISSTEVNQLNQQIFTKRYLTAFADNANSLKVLRKHKENIVSEDRT